MIPTEETDKLCYVWNIRFNDEVVAFSQYIHFPKLDLQVNRYPLNRTDLPFREISLLLAGCGHEKSNNSQVVNLVQLGGVEYPEIPKSNIIQPKKGNNTHIPNYYNILLSILFPRFKARDLPNYSRWSIRKYRSRISFS